MLGFVPSLSFKHNSCFAFAAIGRWLLLIVASSSLCILAFAFAVVRRWLLVYLFDADSFPAALDCCICTCPLNDKELVTFGPSYTLLISPTFVVVFKFSAKQSCLLQAGLFTLS